MNASDLFVKALENEGVEYIFGVPGEENLDFLEAMRKSNIKLILTRHVLKKDKILFLVII